MKNIHYYFVVWFAAVAVLVFVVAIGLRGRDGVGVGGVDSGGKVRQNVGGSVSIVPSPSGDEAVTDAALGFAVVVPQNWYVEPPTGPELTVYPDYDPAAASSSPAMCKIEVTKFTATADTDVNDWITRQLHADPTAQVAEVSRTPVELGSAGDGTMLSGTEWQGALNGVTTTLVYAAAPASAANPNSESIFEIAPSTLSEASDADNGDCDLDLQAFIANFTITAYEP